MDFDFTSDQHEIKKTARELLAKRSGFEQVRAAIEAGGRDDALWGELVELGWPGIALGEEHDGGGLGVVELAILCEELGYALAATPLLGTATAALVLAEAGSDAQRERWLGGLATGELVGALGTPDLIPDGGTADVAVVLSPDGARVVEGGDLQPVQTIDPTRRYARADAKAGELIDGDITGGVSRATVAVSAELIGIQQRALDMSVAFVKERKQFGVPVGSFQAVSHLCATMLRHVESTRSATYFAAWAADASPDRLAEGASLAKAAASDGGREVTASAIQAHGGIGFTWEADVHWLYKRAQLDAQHLGGSRLHRAALAQIAAQRLAAAA